MPLRSRWVSGAVLVAVALAAQLPGWDGPERFDDVRFIALNPRVQDAGRLGRYVLDPAADVPGIRLPDYPYRPVAEASFLAVARMGGGIRAQRGLNLMLHAAASVLVWLLLRRMLAGDPAGEGAWPLLGACGFAAHPLAVQAVTYASQRFVVLMTVFGLLAAWAYLRALDGGGRRWRVLAGAAVVLALGTKESAVGVPLWLGLLECCASPGPVTGGRLRRWIPFAALALLVPLQGVRLAWAHGWDALQPGREAGWWEGPVFQARAFWGELGLHVFPFHLSFFRQRDFGCEGWAGWMSLALLGGVAAWVLLGPGRCRLLRLGAGWLLAPQLLELLASGYVFHHRWYPGLAGAALLFTWAMSRLRWGRPLGVLVVALFGIQTMRESAAWGSQGDLLARDVRFAPGNQKNRQRIPLGVLRRGDPARALRLFQVVAALPGGTQEVGLGLSRALERQGRRREALALFEDPGISAGQTEYFEEAARLAWLEGDQDLALRFAARAAAGRPGDGGIGLAQLLVSWGRFREAEALMRTATQGLPRYPQGWENLGIALSRQGRLAEAEASCRRAVRLAPDLPEAHNDLAGVLALQDRLPEAERALREAVRLRPDYAMAWKNLGILLGLMGRPGEAGEAEARALACPADPRLEMPP